VIRSIVFIDPPAFYTTVERLVAPALRGRPVAVAPANSDRATLLAVSPEARVAGLTRDTPVHRAHKICPDIVLLPPNPALYARASQALTHILRFYAPTIEPRGYGHAFLDLTGTGQLFGPAVDVAERIRREVQHRLGLPLSIGVASNKLVSEAAAAVIKEAFPAERTTPLLDIPRGQEATFLAPHPVVLLPDVPPRVRTRLDEYRLDLIGEVAAVPERQLCVVFGRHGSALSTRARGIDQRPVLPPEIRQEFRTTHTLATDTNDLGTIHPLLRRLSERIGRRLRHRRLVARRLTVQLTYADHTTAARTIPLRVGNLDVELWDAARRAFTQANDKRIAIREIALTAYHFLQADVQLELWDDPPATPDAPTPRLLGQREEGLQRVIDQITTRWGARGVRVGVGSRE
jgi:DNA polymerase-4